MKKTLEMVNQSLKGSNGKIDHKRLTVFAFVILVFIISGVALYKKTPIANQGIVEYILVTAGTIIVGGMGLTKINLKTDIKNET